MTKIIIPPTVIISQQAVRITEMQNDNKAYALEVEALERKANILRDNIDYLKMVKDAVEEDENMRDAWETFLYTMKDLDQGPEKTPEIHAMMKHPAFKIAS